jgi:hypothetical protein
MGVNRRLMSLVGLLLIVIGALLAVVVGVFVPLMGWASGFPLGKGWEQLLVICGGIVLTGAGWAILRYSDRESVFRKP